MKCPNCGFNFEEELYECPHCGIVFAKWEEHQVKKDEGLLDIPAWYQKHISPTARILRGTAGVISLGLALIILLQGLLSSSFGAFLLVVLYSVFGLYMLFSSMQRVAVGRFAIEGIVLLIVSLLAFISFPSAFAFETQIYQSTTKPLVPQNVTSYINTMETTCSNIEHFISIKEIKDDNQAVDIVNSIDIRPVHKAFQMMSNKDQENFRYAHDMIHGLKSLLVTLQDRMPKYLPKGPAAWLPKTLSDSIKRHVESTRLKLHEETEKLKSVYRFNLKPHLSTKQTKK